jgi:hypothetical protein
MAAPVTTLAFDATNLTNMKRPPVLPEPEIQILKGMRERQSGLEEALRRLFFMPCRTTSRTAS